MVLGGYLWVHHAIIATRRTWTSETTHLHYLIPVLQETSDEDGVMMSNGHSHDCTSSATLGSHVAYTQNTGASLRNSCFSSFCTHLEIALAAFTAADLGISGDKAI